jgi:hypothetical protein
MKEKAYEAFEQYLEALQAGKPPAWDQLPDIGLYMDQVTGYLERQLGPLFPSGKERAITSSMINNYAKAKIIPRAESKKYSQEHIALLLAVFTLKKALSVQDMGLLLAEASSEGSYREFYDRFRAALTTCALSTAQEIRVGLGLESAEGAPEVEVPAVDDAKLRTLALRLAVEASLRSLAAERLLAMLQAEEPSRAH